MQKTVCQKPPLDFSGTYFLISLSFSIFLTWLNAQTKKNNLYHAQINT